MPVHLRPISRREFLARSLIGAAGLAAGPASFAASKSADKDSWALLSDIHLAADRNLVARGVNMTEHFLTASKELLALPRRPAGASESWSGTDGGGPRWCAALCRPP